MRLRAEKFVQQNLRQADEPTKVLNSEGVAAVPSVFRRIFSAYSRSKFTPNRIKILITKWHNLTRALGFAKRVSYPSVPSLASTLTSWFHRSQWLPHWHCRKMSPVKRTGVLSRNFLSYFGVSGIPHSFPQVGSSAFRNAFVICTDSVQFLLFQLFQIHERVVSPLGGANQLV
jgi:hypothetical protein